MWPQWNFFIANLICCQVHRCLLNVNSSCVYSSLNLFILYHIQKICCKSKERSFIISEEIFISFSPKMHWIISVIILVSAINWTNRIPLFYNPNGSFISSWRKQIWTEGKRCHQKILNDNFSILLTKLKIIIMGLPFGDFPLTIVKLL